MARTNLPIVAWDMVEPGRDYRGEWRGHRLRVHQDGKVGMMWAGSINGGRVLRARSRVNAQKRLLVELAKRWKEEETASAAAIHHPQ